MVKLKEDEMVFNKKQYQKEHRARPEAKAKRKAYYQRPEAKAKRKAYYQRPEVKKRIREYNKNYMREYYKKNTEKFKGYVKKYQTSEKGKKKIKEYNKEYYQRPETIQHMREYRKKYVSDKSNRLKHHFLYCFRRILKRYHKTGVYNPQRERNIAYSYIGVDFKKIIKHLEPLPKNLEKYHVDHIIPLVKFDFTKKEDIKKAWAPNNIRLITIKENLKKGSKLL